MRLLQILWRIKPFLYRNHLFIFQTQDFIIKPAFKIDSEYQIKFPCEINDLTDKDLEDVGIDKMAIMGRVDAGDLIGLIFWQNKIVHRSLLQTRGKARMLGDARAFMVTENHKNIHFCQTASNHRGKGLYPAMLHHILSYFSGLAQPTAILISCSRENQSSIQGILRAGFHYYKSSLVCGILSERLRFRFWYSDPILEQKSNE